MIYIKKTFDLILIELVFFGFFFSVTSNSFDYYFNNKFYEGFQIVASTIIFTLLNLPLLVLLFFRKDFINLKEIGLIVFGVFIFGFLGFKIPLIILPFIISYGILRLGTQIKSRITEVNRTKNQ